MKGAKKDKAMTVLARKSKVLRDRRSFIAQDGRRFLFGQDKGRLREDCFDRDNWKCRECGSPDWLHMHHIRSRGLGGYDSLGNCLTLCVVCHSLKHVRVRLSA